MSNKIYDNEEDSYAEYPDKPDYATHYDKEDNKVVEVEEYIPDPEWEELKKMWYSNLAVKFEIVKNLVHRETALINVGNSKKTLRCLKINAVKYLDLNQERYLFFDNVYNIYGSLAKFPNLPVFSFSAYVKKIQQEKFNKEYKDLMMSYDFLMDIDNEDISVAKKSANMVKIIFDTYKIPYILKFSGSKGFHFTVEYEDFPSWLKKKSWDELASTLKRFAENFRLLNGIGDIDLSVYDLRRIAKTPYTVVYPFYFIALPLSDSDFDNFDLEKVSLPYWIKNINKVRDRGNLKRKGDNEAFGKLLNEYLEI